MKDILSKSEMQMLINDYYVEHYGKRDDDVWHECGALNVGCFSRDGKIIILKCHILTGEIEEKVEDA